MPLRKVLSDLIVQGKARYNDSVKAFFGTNEDWSLRYDEGAGEWILRDESAGTGAVRIPDGNTLATVLEQGGVHQLNVGGLSGDLADEQDPKAHATEHQNGGVDEINVGGLSGDLADAQDPKAHTTTHQDGGSDEVPVETLPANSTDTSQFFAPDGAGGVTTAAAGGNVPNWQEDGNSPLNGSGAQSHTITLSGTYDRILVKIQELTNTSGGTQEIDIRVNGDSGTNYRYRVIDGTETTSANGINITDGVIGDGKTLNGTLEFVGDKADNISVVGPFTDQSFNGFLVGANQGGTTVPVNSITFAGESGNITIKARVYGWSGGL